MWEFLNERFEEKERKLEQVNDQLQSKEEKIDDLELYVRRKTKGIEELEKRLGEIKSHVDDQKGHAG